LDSEVLAYKFPENSKELDEAPQGFKSMSSQGVIKGCVACLDGYLLQIKVPSSSRIVMSRHIFQDITKHME